jgi:hypothetical protein
MPASVTVLPFCETHEAGDHADPWIELVALVADIGALRESLLGNPAACALDFLVGQLRAPERDLAKSVGRDHGPTIDYSAAA